MHLLIIEDDRDAADYLVKAFRDRGYRVVQDIVDAVMFLESAGFVTGDILHVDGGQNAGDRLN